MKMIFFFFPPVDSLVPVMDQMSALGSFADPLSGTSAPCGINRPLGWIYNRIERYLSLKIVKSGDKEHVLQTPQIVADSFLSACVCVCVAFSLPGRDYVVLPVSCGDRAHLFFPVYKGCVKAQQDRWKVFPPNLHFVFRVI